VVLGHGSRRGRCAEEGLRNVAARIGERLRGEAIARAAFFEFLHPTLEEALTELAGAGVSEVVVVPYFLFAGKEIRIEIPELLAELTPRFPALRVTLAPDLDVEPRLIDVAAERIEEALRGIGQVWPVGGRLSRVGEGGALGVVLVNRGSRARYDDGARLRELAGLLATRLGNVPVEPAQAENSRELTIESAADRLVGAGCARIVVAPYLHFPGKVLTVNVLQAVNRAAAAHPDRHFYLARTLCVDDRIVDVCLDRIASVVAARTSE
jgi:sirohydrochlorin ferrochelatase